MEESRLLDEIVELENRSKVNDILVNNIPIWRIIRYSVRLEYVRSKTGYEARTSRPSMVGKKRVKLLSGLWRYVGKNVTLFYPFNRLVQCDGKYLDKFIDPVIDNIELKDGKYVIIDPPGFGSDVSRVHRENTLSNEGRTLIFKLLTLYFKSVVRITQRKSVEKIFNSIKTDFGLPDYYRSRIYSSLGAFWARYYDCLFWYRLIKPKRVFVVYREGYFPQIAACKKLGIPVAEFQHGITLDNTVSFAGEYAHQIDPDYFLVFGEFWKGPQFGMPLDRIINIGWAYGKYLANNAFSSSEKHQNEVLVISSPEISDSILDSLAYLSKAQGDYSFHIRQHPCETYNAAQNAKLSKIPKAVVVNNKIDSALVLPTYKFVVGENSSVIYEALSTGCKVGMLNMCGLRPAVDQSGIKENFHIIEDISDFEMFIKGEQSEVNTSEFYSKFDNEHFMSFIIDSM